MNGLYQIAGEILQPIRDEVVKRLDLHRDSLGHKLLCMIVTFLLIAFSWIFFRASGMEDALGIIGQIFKAQSPWILFDGSIYKCGIDSKNWGIMLIGLCILAIADYFKIKGIKVREVIRKQDYWFKWTVIIFFTCFILVYGIWGAGYNENNFIYFQF